jgi:hypothetical protein
MPAASGEIGNYGPNKNDVSSGQKVKTSLPAAGYILIIAIFLVVAVVAAACVYGAKNRKKRIARQLARDREMFAPIIMSGGEETISKPDALRWTDTSHRREKVAVGAMPRL